MKKLKKVIASSILFINTLLVSTQVKAMVDLYGIPQPAYGVPSPEKSFIAKFLPIFLIIFIPVILIIGAVVFIKKRKPKKNNKQK